MERQEKTCARGSTREGFCESTFGLIALLCLYVLCRLGDEGGSNGEG